MKNIRREKIDKLNPKTVEILNSYFEQNFTMNEIEDFLCSCRALQSEDQKYIKEAYNFVKELTEGNIKKCKI